MVSTQHGAAPIPTVRVSGQIASRVVLMAQAWVLLVQEFAWTEDALPVRKAERGSSVGAAAAAKLSEEPMFCFEVGCPLLCSIWQ